MPRRYRYLPIVAAVLTGLAGSVVAYVSTPDHPDCVPLHISSSIEPGKLQALRQIADAYNGSAASEFSGTCARVAVSGLSSGDAATALESGWAGHPLAAGTNVPQVWMPTTSMWAELLRYRALHSGATGAVLPVGGPAALVNESPLVVAMPKTMAEAAWPDRKITWADLGRLAADPRGWGAKGHPEWGRFTFGKDDPTRSSSGLAATVALFHAAARGSTRPLRTVDLADRVEFVRGVERQVALPADNAVKFLEILAGYDRRHKPLSFLSAVVLEEQLIYEYNRGVYNNGEAPGEPLVALYPTDGTFLLDHRYFLLDSASDRQKEAADDFLTYLNGPAARARLAAVGFRYDDDGVKVLDASVAEYLGRHRVADDGAVVEPPSGPVLDAMLEIWRNLQKPADILFLLDVSGSMGQTVGATRRVDLVKRAAKKALDQIGEENRVGFWAFSSEAPGADEPYRQVMPMRRFGDIRTELFRRIDDLEPGGGTALYYTLRAAFRDMVARATPDRVSAIVVLTDGKNEYGGAPSKAAMLNEIDARTRERGELPSVPVFTIAFTGDADFDVMQDISEASRGGAYDATSPGEVDRMLGKVFSYFRRPDAKE